MSIIKKKHIKRVITEVVDMEIVREARECKHCDTLAEHIGRCRAQKEFKLKINKGETQEI